VPRAGVVVALVLVGLVLACAPRPVDPPRADGPLSLQVVAHQDDDLLFMNPDLRDDVQAGRPVVTVFLTAGEGSSEDPAKYTASRQTGARAAYAAMADATDDWVGESLRIDADHQVEQYSLRARPSLKLIFVNLPEDGATTAPGGWHALRRLWTDQNESVRVTTVMPADAKVAKPSSYSRYEVLDLLQTLMERFQPTVVRTQDSSPRRDYPYWKPFFDHPDHLMTAKFTEAAARNYRDSARRPVFVEIGYRDYNIEQSPVNLPPRQQQQKLADFGRYQAHDPLLGRQPSYENWPRRMYQRRPRGVSWVGRDETGKPWAFAVLAGRLRSWSGDSWGHTDLGDPGGPLAPGVSVATGRHGIEVCGRRQDDDTIACWRGGRWTGLGSPDGTDGLGAPTLLALGDGRLALFVLNGAGGVSRVEQDGEGAWPSAWGDLGGAGFRDGLGALNGPDGVELFAAGPGGLMRWHGDWRPFGGAPAAGAPVAVGANALVYRVAETGEIAVSRRGPAGWSNPATYPGPGGSGDVAGVSRDDKLTLVGRDDKGRVAINRERPDGGFDDWSNLDGETVDYPAVMTDSAACAVVLAIGPDARLRVNSQSRSDAGFNGWRAAG
jgi:LmbE family N-acetylglucosaminyl deacetylase